MEMPEKVYRAVGCESAGIRVIKVESAFMSLCQLVLSKHLISSHATLNELEKPN